VENSQALLPTTSTSLPKPNQLLPQYTRPLQAIDFFVDDFIGAAQGGRRRLVRIRRVLMQAIDDVFRPLEADDPVHGSEPISVRKLLKGDASWATCKKVPGWIIDSVQMTLTLPKRRLDRLAEILAEIHPEAQTLAGMGSPDPLNTLQGKLDFRLKKMLACYSKEDPPPNRVKPIPVPILWHIMAQADLAGDPVNQGITDMICLAFLFLLRQGEYTGTSSETQPFSYRDIEFYLGDLRLDKSTATADQLLAATFVTFEFTTQKNSVRGKIIGLGRSGDPHFCPVSAAARHIIALRQAQAPLTQPLASYVNPQTNRLRRITPSDITHLLRTAVTVLGPQYGFLPKDILACSFRASGAMALLCANVDTNRIRLIGRWRLDEMLLRYLHVQAEPIMRHFASRMLAGGNFTLLPNHEVPLL
jgi:hypothetical protein